MDTYVDQINHSHYLVTVQYLDQDLTYINEVEFIAVMGNGGMRLFMAEESLHQGATDVPDEAFDEARVAALRFIEEL
jgi:hypothetical protein